MEETWVHCQGPNLAANLGWEAREGMKGSGHCE